MKDRIEFGTKGKAGYKSFPLEVVEQFQVINEGEAGFCVKVFLENGASDAVVFRGTHNQCKRHCQTAMDILSEYRLEVEKHFAIRRSKA